MTSSEQAGSNPHARIRKEEKSRDLGYIYQLPSLGKQQRDLCHYYNSWKIS
jgi:hypothetical protein